MGNILYEEDGVLLTSEQNEALFKINHQQEKLEESWLDYWQQFSNLDSWQFWLHCMMFIFPLVVIYFKIDRKKAFEVGFFWI